MRTLEAYFGRRLFVRHGPKMTVTAEAHIFASGLRRGFRQIEEACVLFQSQRDVLLKAPSTLTMRWLLDAPAAFRATRPAFEVQIASVWMDVDTVDFFSESYDCAILLGAGKFGEATQCEAVRRMVIPVCSRATATVARTNPAACELIHPSPDRRDWRRWLKGSGHDLEVDITRGQVFDMLERGSRRRLRATAFRSAISRCARRPSTRSSSCCRSRPPSIRGRVLPRVAGRFSQSRAGARTARVSGKPAAAPDVSGHPLQRRAKPQRPVTRRRGRQRDGTTARRRPQWQRSPPKRACAHTVTPARKPAGRR